MNLKEALADKEIIVVGGAGGVGKTTTSAALAVEAAKDRKAIVVTIDPAKRLASALGLSAGLGHRETRVELAEAPGRGSLFAAMLDMKTAWDDLIDRYSPTRAQAQHIKENRLYQGVSEQFVGSQGYMAMERLADLHERGDYDLVVIDTPPTRSALDFLEAPKRMTDFIGGSLLRWMARPYAAAGKLGLRAFNFTASPFLKIADRVLGSQVLEDLSALVLDFQQLYEGFKERADDVLRLLSSEGTGFVVVTTLEGPPLEEAGFFIDRLTDEQLPLSGVVANKVTPLEFADADPAAVEWVDIAQVARTAALEPQRARDALDEARNALETFAVLARRDRRNLEALRDRSRAPVAHVPLLTHDIHDVDGLRELGRYLLGEPLPATIAAGGTPAPPAAQ
jgi:anion-transporting  ArsA/GET3 family ATPase